MSTVFSLEMTPHEKALELARRQVAGESIPWREVRQHEQEFEPCPEAVEAYESLIRPWAAAFFR